MISFLDLLASTQHSPTSSDANPPSSLLLPPTFTMTIRCFILAIHRTRTISINPKIIHLYIQFRFTVLWTLNLWLQNVTADQQGENRAIYLCDVERQSFARNNESIRRCASEISEKKYCRPTDDIKSRDAIHSSLKLFQNEAASPSAPNSIPPFSISTPQEWLTSPQTCCRKGLPRKEQKQWKIW